MSCPNCGSEKLTTVRLPKPAKDGEPPSTQPGWRCLECDAQWSDPEQWRLTHAK
jgi:transposase-like protein